MRMKKAIISIFILFMLMSSFSFARVKLKGFFNAHKDTADSNNEYYANQSSDSNDWYMVYLTTTATLYVVGRDFDNYDIAWSSRTSITWYEPKEMYANPFQP
jgi:hypothetical protein